MTRLGKVTAMVLVLLGAAVPVAAKVPPFDTTVEVQGNTVDVIVEFEDDFDAILEQEVESLLAVYPAHMLGVDGRPPLHEPGIPLTLTRREPRTYVGAIELADGAYAIVPFPQNGGVPTDVYRTVTFTTPSTANSPTTGLLLGVSGTAIAFAVWWSRRHREGSANPQHTGA